jgi:PEP-CTERM motif
MPQRRTTLPFRLFVLVFVLLPTECANAQVIVLNDIYTSNNTLTIKHYTSAGSFLNSFTIPSTYGSQMKGLAYGPDGLMYATVGIDSAGFNVVALDAAGNVHQTYSGSEGVNGNGSYGKIGFATNGQFFVGGQTSLRRFTIGNPVGTVIYNNGGQVLDVEGLPSGNLLVLSGNQIQEITTLGGIVRTIVPDTGLASARGIEYNPATNSIYVTMFGFSGQFYRILRLNAQNGVVDKNVMYTQPDDLSLTLDNRILVGSDSQNVGVFDLDLNQIGSLSGGQQTFVTQFAPTPEPGALVLIGIAAAAGLVRKRLSRKS